MVLENVDFCCFMKFVFNAGVKLVKSRLSHGSVLFRPPGGEMCNELKTKVLRLLPANCNGPLVPRGPQTEILSLTVKALKDGHVVGVPTDTIYGLACLAQDRDAIRKVYDIKARNQLKPLAICVGEIPEIYKYCNVKVAKGLLEDLLPGPVTLVFERAEVLNKDLNPFTQLVGVRIPDHAFMRRLCQMCEEPLALTSANVSSQTSTVEVNEFQDLWPKLEVVVDGGPIGDLSRMGSTVVDLSVPSQYRIIRPGCTFSATVDVLEHKYGLSEVSGGK